MKYLTLTKLVLFLGILVLISSCSKDPLMLVTKDSVPVYHSEADSMASPSPEPLIILPPKQSVVVKECVDVKHYIIYKVELADGRIGYINAGEYDLVRGGKPSYC